MTEEDHRLRRELKESCDRLIQTIEQSQNEESRRCMTDDDTIHMFIYMFQKLEKKINVIEEKVDKLSVSETEPIEPVEEDKFDKLTNVLTRQLSEINSNLRMLINHI